VVAGRAPFSVARCLEGAGHGRRRCWWWQRSFGDNKEFGTDISARSRISVSTSFSH